MQGLLMKPDMHQATREKRKTVTRRLDHLKEINQAPDKCKIYPLQDSQKRFYSFFDGHNYEDTHEPLVHVKPRYHVDEVVYIKEAYTFYYCIAGRANIRYELDKVVTWVEKPHEKPMPRKGYHSPLFMPTWAARTFIKITDVRPERLWAITEADAFREGLYAEEMKTCWQGYRELQFGDMGSDLIHQQAFGETPPDWMVEPHKMLERPDLLWTARKGFIILWDSINPKYPWSISPWVFRYEFVLLEAK